MQSLKISEQDLNLHIGQKKREESTFGPKIE